MSTQLKKNQNMQELADDVGLDLIPVKEKSLIEVTILSKSRNKILVDVKGITLGFIPEKEFSSDIYDLKAGDKVLAYVLCVENDDGYAVLSLKKADKERFVTNLNQKFKDQETIPVRIKQANRGGLIAEFGSLEGFLPASQLASNHYPKVGDNKDRILSKLNEMVGQNLKVKIINFDQANNKLIFSEKAAGDSILEEKLHTLSVGQVLDGVVSGVVDFGIFIDVGGLEGLVHISEISWNKVDNLRSLYKVGDPVKVKVLSIENNKVYFSIKRLANDPWLEFVKDLAIDQKVMGKVSKVTPFGVFVEINNQIKGLVHISELVDKMKETKNGKLEDILSLGQEYQFVIKEIDPDNHKINLVLANEEVVNKSKKTSTDSDTKTKEVKSVSKKTAKPKEKTTKAKKK